MRKSALQRIPAINQRYPQKSISMRNPTDTEYTQTIYGSFHSWKNDLIKKHLKQYSAHTRNELAMLKSLIREGDNIIDIGAHIGTFSVPFALFNYSKGKVFAFEANPDNYNLLINNISENDLEEIIIPTCAIVSFSNKHMFEMSLPNDGNSGMYYFLPGSVITGNDPGVVNIDSWHNQHARDIKIDLIKIDVEGAEASALQSCEKLIGKYRPVLYIEICKSHLGRFNTTVDEIEKFLNTYGYHYFRNNGPRNSTNDLFKIARLNSIDEGGTFYDLLAIHPSDARHPE